MSECIVNQEVVNAFRQGTAAKKSKDEIKMDMLNAGASIGSIHRTFMYLMKQERMYIEPSRKREIIHNVLMPLDLTEKEVFESAVEQISSTIPDIDEAKATRIIIRWCKHNHHPYFANTSSRGDIRKFTSGFLGLLSDNQLNSEDQVRELVEGINGWHPTTNAVKSYLDMYLEIYNTFKTMQRYANANAA